jgi:hypothetical protein
MERTIVPRDAQKVQHKNYAIIMFPETDELSNIISDTIKVVFKRRLVDRVLRLWTQLARGQGFPRRDQIKPSKAGGRLGKLPRDRRAIACTAFIFGRCWGELIVYALPRG